MNGEWDASRGSGDTAGHWQRDLMTQLAKYQRKKATEAGEMPAPPGLGVPGMGPTGGGGMSPVSMMGPAGPPMMGSGAPQAMASGGMQAPAGGMQPPAGSGQPMGQGPPAAGRPGSGLATPSRAQLGAPAAFGTNPAPGTDTSKFMAPSAPGVRAPWPGMMPGLETGTKLKVPKLYPVRGRNY